MSGRGGLQDTDPGGRASLLEWGSSIKSSSVCADEVPVVLLLLQQGCWQVVLDPGNPWAQEYQMVNICGLPWTWAGRRK